MGLANGGETGGAGGAEVCAGIKADAGNGVGGAGGDVVGTGGGVGCTGGGTDWAGEGVSCASGAGVGCPGRGVDATGKVWIPSRIETGGATTKLTSKNRNEKTKHETSCGKE